MFIVVSITSGCKHVASKKYFVRWVVHIELLLNNLCFYKVYFNFVINTNHLHDKCLTLKLVPSYKHCKMIELIVYNFNEIKSLDTSKHFIFCFTNLFMHQSGY